MNSPKVKLIFPFSKMNERKRANVTKAHILLSKAGVKFDSAYDLVKDERVWELGHINGAKVEVR